jgi:putative hydrolase of the HAD superfamily
MTRTIQAVLFDLGDTLMYSPNPWPAVHELAGRTLSASLCAHGIEVDNATFYMEFRQRLDRYYADRDRNLVETTTLAVLTELLDDLGQSDVPYEILRRSLDTFYGVTQQNWMIEEDASTVLMALQQAGMHLGLISNAGDERDVLKLVENFGIGRYFDFVLTSAGCGYRKPHPHIFGVALAQWGYMPDEIAMVGDRLDADIGGARPLGIYSIWIRRRAKKLGPIKIPPDAIVDSLWEVPALVLNHEKPGSDLAYN